MLNVAVNGFLSKDQINELMTETERFIRDFVIDEDAHAAFDILPSLNEGDSAGFCEATGSTSSRVPAGLLARTLKGSCCRPLMQFA